MEPRAVQNSENQLEMTFSQDKTTTAIKLHFGSPKVFLASSLLFEVVDFGTSLGSQASTSMALMSDRLGGADLTQGYSVATSDVVEVVEDPKRMMLYLNVDAPLIFVPSCTDEKKGPTIVIDLGRVVVDHDSGIYQGKPPDFFHYKIDMTDLNAFITEGDSADPKAYDDGAIIKKFNMHFDVGVRTNQNSEIAATKLAGKLPEINVFVTKEKLRDILIVASSIKPPEGPKALPSTEVTTTTTTITTATPTPTSKPTTTVATPTKREFILDASFSIEAFNLMLRDTTEGTAFPVTRRGTALARISFNGLETNFVMSNEDMGLDVKLARLRIKDRTAQNKKSPLAKNLVASPKGT